MPEKPRISFEFGGTTVATVADKASLIALAQRVHRGAAAHGTPIEYDSPTIRTTLTRRFNREIYNEFIEAGDTESAENYKALFNKC
jgi:hypothetical protein